VLSTKQYGTINECLLHLRFVLNKLGISDFTLSEHKQTIGWHLEQVINEELFTEFATHIDSVYKKAKDLGG